MPTRKYKLDGKPFWKSKTILVNLLLTVSGGVCLLMVDNQMSDDAARILVFVSAIVNIYLRYITSQPINTL